MSTVGKRYATALYDLAEEQGLVQPIGEGLDAVAAAWEASDELRASFEDPRVAQEGKRKLIEAIAERVGAHTLLRNVLVMLSDRRRLAFLPDVAESYRRIAERRSGRIRAEIVSATALPEAYYEQLTRTLEQATGKQVVLVRRVDASLIAGVVTTVGGRVFDGSLKNRLRGLRGQLLAASDPSAQARSQ